MWLPRRWNILLQRCLIFAFLIVLVHNISNVFDLLFYYVSWRKNTLPLSIQCNIGRLGNQMCTYATLYGVSTLNNRDFVALSCNVQYLKDIFIGPSKAQSIYSPFYLKIHSWNLHPYLKEEDSAIPDNSNFLSGYIYPCSYTFFDHVSDEIRQEFRFHGHLQEHAQSVLRRANVNNLRDVTYVSVHVRRGDYSKSWLQIFDGVPVNMEYFNKSIQYFREKYDPIIFIAVSDDRLWCIENLSGRFGVYVPEEAPSPAHDLAVLANVNHSIMSYGTFGFWGAYLAGGEVIYFDKFLNPNTTFTLENFIFEKMYPSRWKGIVTLNASYWLQNQKKEGQLE